MLLASAYVPIAGPFFGLLTALPFLYYATTSGSVQGVKTAAFSALIIALLVRVTGHGHFVFFIVQFALLGISLAWLFKKELSVGQTAFFATLLMFLLSVGFLTFIGFLKGLEPREMVFDYLNDQLQLAVVAYKEIGVTGNKSVDLETYGKSLIKTLLIIYPSLMIISSGFVVWLNMVAAKLLFRITNLRYPDFVPMERWKAPDMLIWIVIISGFALFLTAGSIKFLSINILIVTMTVYVFHGFSIMLFFLNKYNTPLWARVLIYFFVVIQQILLAGLALLGLFDQWIDFRKLQKNIEA